MKLVADCIFIIYYVLDLKSTIPPSGHKTYVGFMYLEHTQNNSVLNVFVQLMLQSVGAGHNKMEDQDPEVQRGQGERVGGGEGVRVWRGREAG